jgi:hypothetical protein
VVGAQGARLAALERSRFLDDGSSLRTGYP